jgi:serine protease inhibitor
VTKGVYFVLIAAPLLGGCSSEASEPRGKERELAAKSAAFALKLHGALLRKQPAENVFLSPVSAFLALSMAASGAVGPTRDEMLAALELQGWTRDDIDRGCGVLLRWLKEGEPNVRLEVANSAWLRQDFPFHAPYVKKLEEVYQAEATSLDFSNPKSLDRINAWATEKTHGRIPKAAPDAFRPLDVLFLINAVYFKGAWECEFKKSETRNEDFTLPGGKKKSLPFMRRTASYEILEENGLRAIRIPYGEKKRLALYVFLPREAQTLLELHEQLASRWSELKAKFGAERVQLLVPRFKLELEVNLKEALLALGMKIAFSSGADFSGISPEGKNLYISAVQQKTFVEVNEEGTEAAAATSVMVAAKAAEPHPLREFRVDRPFFCAIVDDTTGAFLFTGSIVEPK